MTKEDVAMDSGTYSARRATLRKTVSNGLILLLGQSDVPRNYVANTYPFRQDSSFLYYVGTNLQDMAMVITPKGDEILFGPAGDPDDLVWNGPHPVLADHARESGLARTADISTLKDLVSLWRDKGEKVHYLPPYRADRSVALSVFLGMPLSQVENGFSAQLVSAVVAQREIKTEAEIIEIERAVAVSAEMYDVALRTARPGIKESEVAGAMQGVSLKYDGAQSFLPIVTVRGEVLHNNYYGNTMNDGDLLLIDSGTESPGFYASDITRTVPVSGKYSAPQKDIYQVVLNAQLAAIEAASPKSTNKDLHLIAARTIASGLKDLGLMKGDVDQAVLQGAHALFYVHGLGHMLGLDVHDMEDLGDAVGYAPGQSRSSQFGLMFLRLAKQLKAGFVLTFEPGIYFVPALIDRWKEAGTHADFINYDEVEKYRNFGGVRIEDDILITDTGCRILGKPIPKTIEEVESAMAR
jgi:Xaa-Pro aminopeptidase